MPRDIPVGNGDLLITFDRLYRVRDIYYPHVGQYNHTDGYVQRFGVWVDGKFAWIEDAGWKRSMAYEEDTLVTRVVLRHDTLGLEITCSDAVDFHEPAYFRRCVVRDLLGKDRDVRLFMHWDLSIKGSPVGDTANYDPATASLVVYKDDTYFLFNACDENKCGIDNWAIGTSASAARKAPGATPKTANWAATPSARAASTAPSATTSKSPREAPPTSPAGWPPAIHTAK
jgi:GH15 family glucan-1,4-alpha-glucosidase